MPFGTLPKFPTVGLRGCAMANARGLKCSWSSSARFGSRATSKIGSPVYTQRANTLLGSGVSVGLVLTMPVLLLRHCGSVAWRSEEHTSELQSRLHLVCRLLLEKKK